MQRFQTDVDVIVIGSGAGGLTAALALANAGQRVLVLEQHYLPGGWCHSFNLDGYRFSPGVHYIGQLDRGGHLRRIYEGLGLGDELVFCELNPRGYDHVLIGDGARNPVAHRFDYPKGREALCEALAQKFPHEREGLRRYFDTIIRFARELDSMSEIRGARDVLAMPFKQRTALRWLPATGAQFIDAHVRDPLLRSILAAQAGDHGLPPSQVAAAFHAGVQAHYFDGAYYPRGGGGALPRAYVHALQRAGAEVRVRCAVERILVEGEGDARRAIGVRLADGTEIRAAHVISNADPGVTYGRLLAPEHVPPAAAKRLARTRWSVSSVSLFLAVDMDLRAAGLDSGNYWYYAQPDVDAVYRQGLTAWDPDAIEIVPGMFLTVTTLKDPTKSQKGHHTCEAFCFISNDAFRRWEHTPFGERPAEYEAFKQKIADRMLTTIDRFVPGFSRSVVYKSVGTPLTNTHYVAATAGNLYGTDKVRGQIGPFAFQVRSELKGLWQCGASTMSHGVHGATVSGLAAARGILRCRTSELLSKGGGELRIYPSDDLSAWPEALRGKAKRAGRAASASVAAAGAAVA